MSSNTSKKTRFLDRLAADNGVAIVVLAADGREIASANNNSICRSLSVSKQFGSKCAEFCGKAFEKTAKGGTPIEYVCYAGLTCKAVPVWDGGSQFVAITGRTFLKAESYREATERAIAGDWKQFPPTDFFENVLISSSTDGIEKACVGLDKFAQRERNDILELDVPAARTEDDPILETNFPQQSSPHPPPDDISDLISKFHSETTEVSQSLDSSSKVSQTASQERSNSEWRSLFGSLMKLNYKAACETVLGYLRERHQLDSLVWLERRGDKLEVLAGSGRLAAKNIKIGIAAENKRLLDAAQREMPLEFRERKTSENVEAKRTLSLFPVLIGNEIRGAIGVDSLIGNNEQKRVISRFAQTLASQLEILRLRDEVAKHDWLSNAVVQFNDGLRGIDADDFWLRMTQISAELVNAERASILIHNEKANNLQAKASIGTRFNLVSEKSVGVRVASSVLDGGEPVVVADVNGIGIGAAPKDWNYKGNSFISFPILIGERKVGVLNFTDKADGHPFTARDLELLQAIAPQIAVAIDRTAMKDKAGEYAQLSVTDPLTGLLNRRYLEERLNEEIVRSHRHRFSMSLMMLDVDEFKSYNDNFGHPAGDRALMAVAEILKETLRGADVAARYGGEEFAILLPQTSPDEAAQIAERIRSRVERTEFPHRQVTISIGVAGCTREVNTAKDLLSAADVALYAAKNSGRNSVKIFDAVGDMINGNVH